MNGTGSVDPITLTVIWNTMLSIADELGTTLRHTAFSEGVREGDDFSTALFDRNALMVAQGNFSPGHLGSMPTCVKRALEYIPPETLKPGDSILLNDSFIGSGHFPDTFQIMPVFLDDRLIGFVACSAHQVDMGGAAPGSQKVHGVTEAFQEGLRILPVRFVREGRIDDDILRLGAGKRQDAGQDQGRPAGSAHGKPDSRRAHGVPVQAVRHRGRRTGVRRDPRPFGAGDAGSARAGAGRNLQFRGLAG